MELEKCTDPLDRAAQESDVMNTDALAAHARRVEAETIRPKQDGLCACGCGEAVPAGRLALGYGLTVECQQDREDAKRRARR